MKLLMKLDDACHWKRNGAFHWFLRTCSSSHVERSIRSYRLVLSQCLRGKKAVMSAVSFMISYHLTEIWEPWPWKVLSSQVSSFRSWIFAFSPPIVNLSFLFSPMFFFLYFFSCEIWFLLMDDLWLLRVEVQHVFFYFLFKNYFIIFLDFFRYIDIKNKFYIIFIYF